MNEVGGQGDLGRVAPLEVHFGTVSDVLRNKNTSFKATLLAGLKSARVIGMTTAVPEESNRRLRWGKEKPKSLTFISLSESLPDKTAFTGDRAEVEAASGVSRLLRTGKFKHELAVSGQQILKAKGRWYVEDGKDPVPVIIVDRKVAGQEGIDRVLIATYWRDDRAREGIATFNGHVTEEMGQGEIIDARGLAAIVEQRSFRTRNFGPAVARTFHHLGQRHNKKEDG